MPCPLLQLLKFCIRKNNHKCLTIGFVIFFITSPAFAFIFWIGELVITINSLVSVSWLNPEELIKTNKTIRDLPNVWVTLWSTLYGLGDSNAIRKSVIHLKIVIAKPIKLFLPGHSGHVAVLEDFGITSLYSCQDTHTSFYFQSY